MSLPTFTAQASLYKTGNRYRPAAYEGGGTPSDESITPAYMPGPETQAICNEHIEGCLTDASAAAGVAAGICAAGCIAAGPFYGICLAPCLGGVVIGYNLQVLQCTARNVATRCCPKLCAASINPLDPGAGCCDHGDTCVDRYDPNSRQGCCPGDQTVCAGKCCAKGESCCGETCCPPGYFCRDGLFCEQQYIGTFPHTPPPKAHVNKHCMITGGSSCGSGCCPTGMMCCGVYSDGQPDCKWGSTINACLH